jgi:transcription elongation factor GreA
VLEITKNWLRKQIAIIDKEKPLVSKSIGEAAEKGDLSENAEYHAARERLGLLEAQDRQYRNLLSESEKMQKKWGEGDTIGIGTAAILKVNDEYKCYIILSGTDVLLYDRINDAGYSIKYTNRQYSGEEEVELSMCTSKSPIGKHLAGKKIGDSFEFNGRAFSIMGIDQEYYKEVEAFFEKHKDYFNDELSDDI